MASRQQKHCSSPLKVSGSTGECNTDFLLHDPAAQGLKMWKELFCKRCHCPAIILGVIMSLLAALLDPLSRTYVAYQSLTRSGMSFGNAVLISSVTLYGAFAVGECSCRPICRDERGMWPTGGSYAVCISL
jgi:hypothetical protein